MTVTSADLSLSTDSSGGSLGVVGARNLIALQTIDISSLTSHPVPIVPNRFVAVTGRGPIDSNGSGKSSFLAATSLLLGDAQWGLNVDGKDAAKLLFDPESAGLDSNLGYRRADVGFIGGVFAPPGNADDSDCITVWVRLSAQPQYVRVRWTRGVLLADDGDDERNSALVEGLWNQMTSASEIGPRTLVNVLYGDSPRCMAYLDANIRKSRSQSLLNQALPSYSPETIADSLIALTGRDILLDKEAEHRAELDLAKTKLIAVQTDHHEATQREARDLAGVAHRDKAREQLVDGDRMWRLHFAAGAVETAADAALLDEQISGLEHDLTQREHEFTQAKKDLARLQNTKQLQSDLELAKAQYETLAQQAQDLEATMTEARLAGDAAGKRLSELEQIAATGDGSSLEASIERAGQAEQSAHEARFDETAARRALSDARDELRAAQEGVGGDARPILQALRAASIDAVALLDTIRVPDADRSAWEPRLWPYRHAAVIAPADKDRALAALSGMPGATLIVADGPLQPPTSVRLIPTDVPLHQFLTAVHERTTALSSPARAEDGALAQVVLGGFRTVLTGRDARIAALTEQVSEAEAAAQAATVTRERADLLLQAARDQLQAAHAALDLISARAVKAGYDETLTVASHARIELAPTLEDAKSAQLEAEVAWRSNAELVQAARARLSNADDRLAKNREDLGQARTRRAALRLEFWLSNWGNTLESAQAALDAEGGLSTRKSATWRNKANLARIEAIGHYRNSLNGDLPDVLQRAIEKIAALERDGDPVDTTNYETVAAPLRDLLDEVSDTDVRLADAIRREQSRRAQVLEDADAEATSIERDLLTLQASIKGRILKSLTDISDAFDALDQSRHEGHGARLTVNVQPPADAAGTWRWSVVPEWKRSASSKYVRYSVQANSAQVKIAAIQLVLAALLTGERRSGRVLILDELGDSLGEVNRREILAAIDQVARDNGVTILGTCQDDVRETAAPVAGQMIWFSHPSSTSAYNQPTRTWGFDPIHGHAIELTGPVLRAGREI